MLLSFITMSFRVLSYFIISALLSLQTGAIVFTFDCKAAPGACDTHCFARNCGGVDWDVQGKTYMNVHGPS